MELATIEMERPKARQAFLDYRKAVRERHNAEDEEIMRGYKALAAGKTLIHLSRTMSAGGTYEYHWRSGWTDESHTSVLPRLAVCRAHVRTAYTDAISRDGSLEMRSKEEVAGHNTFDRVRFAERTFPSHELHDQWVRDDRQRFRAMVPIVPPALRPGFGLHNYHVLWEAEWALSRPEPPADPALLKRIGGDLYAVIATWDLTELEQAVLSGRR